MTGPGRSPLFHCPGPAF